MKLIKPSLIGLRDELSAGGAVYAGCLAFAAMLVAAASLLSEFTRPPHLKWVTYTSSRAIGGAATGLAASLCLSLSHNEIVGIAIATFAGALVAELLDVTFAAIAAQLRGNRSLVELIRTEA